ncbi:uncharacterized protein LOC105689598 [Athalia rosae]|uniref:uncharacterized protein LOC105689598 n=1 Tax=Athalia rosae TaxID=37344 RepID=UPI002033249E|nr:uncharacterized protein LOC105689598 [Athalia rosae]XP_048514786.1 uncharacterized protein LOC105689598 [Athalia rosae]XP_048514787.1 uncharacterized protein LOC105689598 [Athalia rosae]
MPNNNKGVTICGCGLALDNVTKGRNIPCKNCGANVIVGGSKAPRFAKWESRERRYRSQEEAASGTAADAGTGSTSSVQGEQQWRTEKHGAKQGKRLNTSRRTRSAERPDSHYTYIDSASSIVGNGIRENVIPEALYASINGSPNRTANSSSLSSHNLQGNVQNNHSQPVYAVPSMTSPPPTYDVAMWQSGLPPSYEEYLCHKHAVISRSHTPPPPWSDATHSVSCSEEHQREQSIREILSHLANSHAQVMTQLQAQAQVVAHAKLYNNKLQTLGSRQQQRVPRESNAPSSITAASGTATTSNQQLTRDQAGRTQRARTATSRSQSESRARQQRIATMYEDGAFCMETTAIQSAFEHGVAFCSLM